MVNTLPAPQNLVTDAWVKASWEAFLALGDRPYEGMNITGVMGLTEPQKVALIALGAVENGSV
ncbi:hypothetical protein [Thermoleptolyngbya sp. C42_A2020_037]|uniref:hypothetical protein n=1 Tax=Thermoleptolyngbya sp. C42_A2020_037 TaxID=2747799 RepID=UPI0019F7206A|nr:hypothetical protein [Thermoleptolyngbya sp. C42_A2020_037]MBF2083177.1 hypothetical protein [Thermoleptolyngbya sp. C42_A2020_037]